MEGSEARRSGCSPAMDRNPRAIGTPAATNRPQNPSKPDFIVQLVGQARLFVSAITSRRRLIGTFWLPVTIGHWSRSNGTAACKQWH